MIIGLDLLDISQIRQFFSINSKIIYNFYFVLYLFSLDNSSKNLNSTVDIKKLYIHKQLNLFCIEKNSQIITKTNKLIRQFELNNLIRLTKETLIFEFNIINNETLPTFDKISLYTKEFKDIFESVKQEDKKEEVVLILTQQPSSTFKLSLNDNEVKARNDVVLPYLLKNESEEYKEKKLKLMIDPEDLNELYEDDPDGDLDI